MSYPPYIHPHFQQMGAKRQAGYGLARTLRANHQEQQKRKSKCPNTSPWFDLNQRPVDQQMQANLFRLPLEIRRQIYGEMIRAWGPGDGFHIIQAQQLIHICPNYIGDVRLTFVLCECPSKGTAVGRALPSNLNSNIIHNPSKFHSWRYHDVKSVIVTNGWCGNNTSVISPLVHGLPKNRVSVFLSCRRIYSEAIEVLYSSYSFSLSGLEATHRFLSTVAPQSLENIRFLDLMSIQVPDFYTTRTTLGMRKDLSEIQRYYQASEEEWLHVCSILSSMKALQALRIKIDSSDLGFDLEPLFLQPLMDVDLKGGRFMLEAPHHFRVGTSNAKHIAREDWTVPFTIERGSPVESHSIWRIDHDRVFRSRNISRTPLLVNDSLLLCCSFTAVKNGASTLKDVVYKLKSKWDGKITFYKECYKEGARSK